MLEDLKQDSKIGMNCRPLTPRPLLEEDGETFQLFKRSTIQHVKAYAFTLAEVLIVIGIIGVVAALTLPNLNHATGDKEKVTKVKKIYSTLTEAVDRAQVIYGPFDTWFKDLGDDDDTEKNERFAKRVTEFMKVSKYCGVEEGCFSTAPLISFENDVIDDTENYLNDYFKKLSGYTVFLADGMSLGFIRNNKIKVDIDGPLKGKTQVGNDIFDFSIISDAGDNFLLIPDCNNVVSNVSWNDSNDGSGYGGNYTTWVIENGNLDYLKCPDELNWETKTSCK